MLLNKLRKKINQRQAIIGVIGLGYVGLPVAASFAQAGFRVVGVDVKTERVNMINARCNPIDGEEPGLDQLLEEVVTEGRLKASSDYAQLVEADVILIDVETPVDEKHQPDYSALASACADLGSVIKKGALVIVESTVSPGTTQKLVCTLLEESSGGRVNLDFFLGVCPERVMPGKLLLNLRTMNRVCGGSTPKTADTMVALYRHVVEGELDTTDLVTAEVVKTTENAYRDVQIAFANEVALICETIGADVWTVRQLVNKVPSRDMHLPGAGVGGHCIPKDPWLLLHGAGSRAPVRLIPQARSINENMPNHMAELTRRAIEAADIKLASARVAVLGYAYLENSDDMRNSPSSVLVTRLKDQGVEIVVHDPWVEDYRGDLFGAVKDRDAVVVMVAHDEYRQIDLIKLKAALRTPILVDGRHIFDQTQVETAGFVYRCIGKG